MRHYWSVAHAIPIHLPLLSSNREVLYHSRLERPLPYAVDPDLWLPESNREHAQRIRYNHLSL